MGKFVGFDEKKVALTICGEMMHLYAYIILPFCQHGTVLDLLMKAEGLKRKLSLNLVKYLFRSTLLALYELHSLSGLSHCDLKPDNVVFDDNFFVKLIDYGQA